jgi:hypothetical protein
MFGLLMANNPTNNLPRRNPVATIAAVGIIIGFGAFVIHMLENTTIEEKVWTRKAYLLHGVEAIAFAAAGFLFGKEVHRERAEKAEEDAKGARRQAADAEGRGKTLALKVKAAAERQQPDDVMYRASTQEIREESNKKALNDLADMASRLFP